MRQLIAGLGLCVLVAACSSGGGRAPSFGPGVLPNTAALQPQASTGTGTVKVSITIPALVALSPHYVSPSTKSMVVKVYSSKHKLLTSKAVKLTAGAKGCKNAVDVRICTFSFTVAAGKDRFSATTYDGLKGKGHALSVLSNFARTVKAGKTVKLPLALSGIPHSVTLELIDGNPFARGDSTSGFQFAGLMPQTMQVAALDADGNIIAGKGAPTLVLGTSDFGTASVAAVSGTTNDFLVTPHTDASALTLTAAARGTYKGSQVVTLLAGLSIGSVLYVANYGTATPGGNVTAYVPWSATPIETLPGNNPAVVYVDGSGNVWVGNDAGGPINAGTPPPASIVKFAPGSTTPARTISGLNEPNTDGGESLAVDKSGNLYCACNDATEVDEWSPTAGSTPTRALTTTSSPTGIDGPYSVVTDSTGNVYVANYSNNAIGIAVFGPTGTTPIRNITSGVTGVWLLAMDKQGNLYGGNYDPTPNTIMKYAPGGSTAIQTFGAASGLTSIYGLAVDLSGNVYGTNGSSCTNCTTVEYTSASVATPSRTFTLAQYSYSVTTDPLGNVYVPVSGNSTVAVFPPGTSTTASRTLTSTNGINTPYYVATWP